MFIESSRDILNIVLAFCILWLTIFTAWFIYYLIMIMREVFKATREMRDRINRVDEAIRGFKDKFNHASAYFVLIGELIKKAIAIVGEKEGKKRKND